MRGKFWFAIVLALCTASWTQSAGAQGYLGGYVGIGLGTVSTTNNCCGSSDGLIGVYYDRTIRHHVYVGADIHAAGENFSFWGAGPRVGVPLFKGFLTPYAEGVFGSANHIVYTNPNTYPSGSTLGSAYGVDIAHNPYVKFRMQYDMGNAGGDVNTDFSVFTFGFVVRIKTR